MVKTNSIWENLEKELPFMRESWVTLLPGRQCRKIFEDIQDEIAEKEEQKLKAIKEQKKQAEREQRAQFRVSLFLFVCLFVSCLSVELLNELSEKQQLHCNSEWVKIVGLLENDARYKTMQEQQSNKLKQVFTRHLEQIKDNIKDDRNKFKKWLKVIENQLHSEANI
ncbi:hypothetical protein RFI_27241 [Reticulomyxa filosa]|uniref:Uncharacterized protein n=1 Tax=Reticulomyxa filosa TaxID=46433 RepID=X6M8Z9_RETFI|nr:hypothetical protein RFI_27241 [Reticulomyxa filosa]|eukprot:ETO10136.1 hypothetical protein RFI_27241 [Reticulomyxa filosa]